MASEDRRSPREPPVRLVPPPRVAPDLAFGQPVGAAHSSAAAILLGGVLALGLVGVFVYLPRWLDAPRTVATSLDAPAAPSVEVAVTGRPRETIAVAPPSTRPAAPPRVAAEHAAPVAAATQARPAPRVSDEPALFAREMSNGLAALDAGRFDEAVAVLARAIALRPEDTTAREALARAEAGVEQGLIEAHLRRAATLAAAERWAPALAEHEAALGIDPNIAAAQAGAALARRRASLDERLDFHVANPERLSDEAAAREAELLLDQAHEIDAAGPRLREQIARLERVLASALTPVAVRLQSDGATDVVIHRVGRLGSFQDRALELRPGTYTVVGTRRGFRDVRRKLVVSPGAPPPALQVRCEEGI